MKWFFLFLCACGAPKPTQAGDVALGSCLTEHGTKMYGAFWCPHCAKQKELFGDDFANVDYIECSNPDHSQNETCNAEGIKGYPTWVFSSGERLVGEQTLETLAQKTGC